MHMNVSFTRHTHVCAHKHNTHVCAHKHNKDRIILCQPRARAIAIFLSTPRLSPSLLSSLSLSLSLSFFCPFSPSIYPSSSPPFSFRSLVLPLSASGCGVPKMSRETTEREV